MEPSRIYFGLRTSELALDSENRHRQPEDTHLVYRIRTIISKALAYMILYWKAKVQDDFLAKCLLEASARESDLQSAENEYNQSGLVNDKQQLLREIRSIFLKSALILAYQPRNIEQATTQVEKFLEGVECVRNEKDDINTLARVLLDKQQADLNDKEKEFITSFSDENRKPEVINPYDPDKIEILNRYLFNYRKAIANLSLSDVVHLDSTDSSTGFIYTRNQFVGYMTTYATNYQQIP